MSIEFQPSIAELTSSGATAALLLDAQKHLSGKCVEEVLKKIDRAVENDAMSAEKALALCHEVAAYRRIVYRQEQAIKVAQRVANG